MKRKIFIPVIILTLASLSACLPGLAPSAEDLQQTQIAEAVQQTQIAMAVEQTLAAGAGAAEPGDVPSDTGSPYPQVPMVSVSVGTNCRSGPGEPYEILGMLNVGESAEVIGRSEYGDTWIIKLPSNPAITCWLWGQYATVVGDVSGLTVYSNPPTPVPEFGASVSYMGMFHCMGFHGFKFRVTNTGDVTWQSFQLNVTDLTTFAFRSFSDEEFTDVTPTCTPLSAVSDLAPGESGVAANLGPGSFNYDLTGHDVSVTIRLCTEDDLGGLCVEKILLFTP